MKEALRKVKDLQYTDMEVKVRDATSNDPWGAKTALKLEIARATHDVDQYPKLFNMLWKRVTDINHVYHVQKGLNLVHFLLCHGAERFIMDCKTRSKHIQRLKKYRHIDADGKDDAKEACAAATTVYALLTDDKLLAEERAKAEKLRANGITEGISNETADRDVRSAPDRSLPDNTQAAQTHQPERISDRYGSIEGLETPAEVVPKRKTSVGHSPNKPKATKAAVQQQEDPFGAAADPFADEPPAKQKIQGAASFYEAAASKPSKKDDVMAAFGEERPKEKAKAAAPVVDIFGEEEWDPTQSFDNTEIEEKKAPVTAPAKEVSSDPWDMLGSVGAASKQQPAVKSGGMSLQQKAALQPKDLDFGSDNPFADGPFVSTAPAKKPSADPFAGSKSGAAKPQPVSSDPFGFSTPSTSTGPAAYDPFAGLSNSTPAPVISSTSSSKPTAKPAANNDIFAGLGNW